MAQTIKNTQIIQKVSEDDTLLLHPETAAEVVQYANDTSKLTATTVQGAVDEVKAKVDELAEGAVTGVKGDKETSYRKGEVNITPANIGAEEEGAVSTHNESTTAHQDIRSAVETAQAKADSAYTLAEGRAKAVAFDTLADLKTALKNASKTDYKVGDNLFIKDVDTPDYWVSAVKDSNSGEYGYFEISILETQKVDLSSYQTKSDSSLNTTTKTVVGGINEVKSTADTAKSTADANGTSITNIVNGTTKVGKAADADSAANATNADNATKWKNSRTIGVTVNSGTKKDGSTAISGTGSQSVDGSVDKTISLSLGDSGVTAGTYSAIQVNTKGIAIAGGQIFEVGTTSQTSPSSNLATGGLFFKVI